MTSYPHIPSGGKRGDFGPRVSNQARHMKHIVSHKDQVEFKIPHGH